MKKINGITAFIAVILLFLISYAFDEQINILFKNLRSPFLGLIFSIITNFGIVVIAMLIIPSIILYRKNKKLVYLLSLAFIISVMLAFIIKLIVC